MKTLTISEFAKETRYTPQQILKFIRLKKIKAFRFTKRSHWRIPASELDRLFSIKIEHTNEPAITKDMLNRARHIKIPA